MKKIIAVACYVLVSLNIQAQNIDPAQAKGKIIDKTNQLNSINGMSQELFGQFKANLHKIKTIALQNPLLQSPKGFNIEVNNFIDEASRDFSFLKLPSGNLALGFSDLYADENTHEIKSDEEGDADLQINFNSFRFLYPDTYSNDVAAVNHIVPVFFFKYSIKELDSTKNYIEFQSSERWPIRVLTNGSPLFVPLTKEQYLKFKIAFDKKEVNDAEKDQQKEVLNLEEIKKEQRVLQKKATLTRLEKIMLGTDTASIKNLQPVVAAGQQLIDTWQQRLNKHQQQFSALSVMDKKSPAYIIWGGENNADKMQELTTGEDENGQELWTINPQYFKKSLPAGDIQLITVLPEHHPQMTSGFMIEKLKALFNKVDYEKLKELIVH